MGKQNPHKQKLKFAVILVATGIFTVPQLQAEEQLPELIITADRIAQDQTSISADVTVISQKDIERSQAASVAELLRSQAGIDVASTGGPGKSTSVFLRGGNSGHTLVLIDGMRVGSATVGSFDWSNLSTADIERIEIVRGPQSSLYGADAMGGVIQIFTRKGKKGTPIRLHGEAGSYGTSSGQMSLSGQAESGVSYALTVDALRTKGVSAAASGTELDPYRQLTVSGRVGLPIGNGELELVGRNVDGRTGLDKFGPADLVNFTSNTKQTVGSAKLTYPITDMIESSLQLSRSTDEVIGRDPAGGFNNSDFRTRIDQLTWQNHIDLDSISLLAGLDIYRSKGYSGSAGLDRSIRQTAGFAVLAWHGDWIDVNGSVRYDNNSATSNKTTYKTGVALHPLTGLKITGNYGTGFKAPSLNDLYFPASAFSAGNPKLKPETSRGWDAGISYRLNSENLKAGLGLVWFDQSYRDLIVWQGPPPTFFYSPANIGKARTKGLEISADLAYGPAYMHANWTYLSAKDSITGDLLPRRAKDSGNVTAGLTVMSLNVEVAWHLVGPRFSSTGNRKPMQGYQKTDIRANYAINKQWKLTARVNNVGDKTYEEVSGYSVLGRAWYAGVSATF
jgi:vitamin B12 transporter